MRLNEVMYHLIYTFLYIGCTLYPLAVAPLNYMSVGRRFLELSPSESSEMSSSMLTFKYCAVDSFTKSTEASALETGLITLRVEFADFL